MTLPNESLRIRGNPQSRSTSPGGIETQTELRQINPVAEEYERSVGSTTPHSRRWISFHDSDWDPSRSVRRGTVLRRRSRSSFVEGSRARRRERCHDAIWKPVESCRFGERAWIFGLTKIRGSVSPGIETSRKPLGRGINRVTLTGNQPAWRRFRHALEQLRGSCLMDRRAGSWTVVSLSAL